MKKAIDREPPSQDDIDQVFYKKYNKTHTTSKGAIVDFASGIRLLNRYCDSLPADQFTSSAVAWNTYEKEGGKLVVGITLPIQSSVQQEILVSLYSVKFLYFLGFYTTFKSHFQSDTLPSLKLAKQSAAYNACVQLHKAGELTDNLMPFNKIKCLQSYRNVYFKSWDQFKDGNVPFLTIVDHFIKDSRINQHFALIPL